MEEYTWKEVGDYIEVTLANGIVGIGWTVANALETALEEDKCPTSTYNMSLRGIK